MPIQTASLDAQQEAVSTFAPFRHAIFLRVWLASLASNFGFLIQGVAAAWAMTQLSPSPTMVAAVQTASFMPYLLLSIVSGAIADVFDRRSVAITALALATISATSLALFAFFNLLTPQILLVFCFLIGSSVALFSPAWQASVTEQVPAALLPQAISLNSISFNIARSFGPAIGGVLVAAAGAVSGFLVNALCYAPMITVLALWKRPQQTPRYAPEGLGTAVISGMRYIMHSPMIRGVLIRVLAQACIGGAITALLPLVARNLLHGDAMTYGLLLGAYGIGAVASALGTAPIRNRFESEHIIRGAFVVIGLTTAAIGFSTSMPLTMIALFLNGATAMMAITTFNIEIQLAAPRWVAGRTLAMFSAAAAGGAAIAGIIWGTVAEHFGLGHALIGAGCAVLVSLLLALPLRLPGLTSVAEEAEEMLSDPEIALALSPRSGPIVVTIEYRVRPSEARAFFQSISKGARIRQRNGAYGWSISREVNDPELWTERYHCPTWAAYLRQRNRATVEERLHHAQTLKFHTGAEPPRVRRMLERPFGSVRWRDDTPDIAADVPEAIIGPGSI